MTIPKEFLVSFSFAGEERELVRSVAVAVRQALGDGTVFFDEWCQDYIAGFGADLKLQEIYKARSVLVVMCISGNYARKPWTGVEGEAIRARIMDAVDERARQQVLPLRVGGGDVPGILTTTISPDIRGKAPEETATLILNRLRLIRPNAIAGTSAEPSLPKVFVADCTPDLEDRRTQIVEMLRDIGWSVLPGMPYPTTNYEAQLDADLRDSAAYIQLLGPYPWKRSDFDRIQQDSANKFDFKRYCYRSTDIVLDQISDTVHRSFLETADIVAGFTDFKQYIETELRVLKHRIEQPTSEPGRIAHPPLVRVLIRSKDPDLLWEQVYQWIYDRSDILADQVPDEESLVDKHEAEPCHGFLVACDASAFEDGPTSTRRYMEQCRQIQLREKDPARRPPVGLVYWPPPDVAWSKLLRCRPTKLFMATFDSKSALDSFFVEVCRVAS